MEECKISIQRDYGFEKIILENNSLKVSVFPEYGAKIWDIIYKPKDYNFLYHHPRVEPRTPVFGMPVDNWWCGGMDECLPTGWACEYEGENLPDLGELWSLPWEYTINKQSPEEIGIYMKRFTVIYPLLIERWMNLKKGSASVSMMHRITNLSSERLKLNWGLHPSFNISPDWKLDLPPADEALIEHSYPDNWLGERGKKYKWPYLTSKNGKKIDLRKIPPQKIKTHDLHYVYKIKKGYLGIKNDKEKFGIRLYFSKDVFKVIWLWLVYGGWRGLYTAAIEAWTGYPVKLSDAIEYGEYMVLEPDSYLKTQTEISINEYV